MANAFQNRLKLEAETRRSGSPSPPLCFAGRDRRRYVIVTISGGMWWYGCFTRALRHPLIDTP